jgi:hypothetical protein
MDGSPSANLIFPPQRKGDDTVRNCPLRLEGFALKSKSMFGQLWRYLFPRRAERRDLTNEDLSRLDTMVVGGGEFECEAVLIENGQVVGETAIFRAKDKLEPTGGPLPSGYSPISDGLHCLLPLY